ncbi:zinc finger protein 60-like [Anopheles cruzii]|uniref:zinc finger protein 60-like n=1 Tax=Anopheles cruzii TaxID=68878 RepID=UPI0022EC4B20|nr:zinc finger protein 60-like [Anopheles cruzii]
MGNINMENICRLCLDISDDQRSIFEAIGECDLRAIIRETVQLDIHEEDDLPKTICTTCANKLISIQEHVTLFRASDRKLRSSLVSSSTAANSIAKDELAIPAKELVICVSNDSDTARNSTDPFDNILAGDRTDAELHSLDKRRSFPHAIDSVLMRRQVAGHGVTNSPSKRSNKDEKQSDNEYDNYDELSYEESVSCEKDITCNDMPEDNGLEIIDAEISPIAQVLETGHHPKTRKRRKTTNSCRDGSTKPEGSPSPALRDYKCYICNSKSLGSQKALLDHFATHVDRVPYTCERCVMKTVILTRVRTLNTHLKMHEQPIKCDYCDRRYSNASGKYYHTQFYHLGGGAPCITHCKVCGKQCGSQDALKKHQKYHTTALKCRHCEKVFNHPNKLRNHELSHDENSGFECMVCKKVLQTIESYDVHLKKHTQERSYQCSLCPKKFNTSCNLFLHMKVHAKNDNYRPTRSWQEHYTIVSREPMHYKCKHCDRYGTDKVNNMISHLQAHFKEYECDRCKRLFATAKQLRAHYTTHTGEKPEMCQHCGKCFANKNGLRTHLRTHTREAVAESKEERCVQKLPISSSTTGYQS